MIRAWLPLVLGSCGVPSARPFIDAPVVVPGLQGTWRADTGCPRKFEVRGGPIYDVEHTWLGSQGCEDRPDTSMRAVFQHLEGRVWLAQLDVGAGADELHLSSLVGLYGAAALRVRGPCLDIWPLALGDEHESDHLEQLLAEGDVVWRAIPGEDGELKLAKVLDAPPNRAVPFLREVVANGWAVNSSTWHRAGWAEAACEAGADKEPPLEATAIDDPWLNMQVAAWRVEATHLPAPASPPPPAGLCESMPWATASDLIGAYPPAARFMVECTLRPIGDRVPTAVLQLGETTATAGIVPSAGRTVIAFVDQPLSRIEINVRTNLVKVDEERFELAVSPKKQAYHSGRLLSASCGVRATEDVWRRALEASPAETGYRPGQPPMPESIDSLDAVRALAAAAQANTDVRDGPWASLLERHAAACRRWWTESWSSFKQGHKVPFHLGDGTLRSLTCGEARCVARVAYVFRESVELDVAPLERRVGACVLSPRVEQMDGNWTEATLDQMFRDDVLPTDDPWTIRRDHAVGLSISFPATADSLRSRPILRVDPGCADLSAVPAPLSLHP